MVFQCEFLNLGDRWWDLTIFGGGFGVYVVNLYSFDYWTYTAMLDLGDLG